jgi:hypothetical protein
VGDVDLNPTSEIPKRANSCTHVCTAKPPKQQNKKSVLNTNDENRVSCSLEKCCVCGAPYSDATEDWLKCDTCAGWACESFFRFLRVQNAFRLHVYCATLI